jgi:hypothetical protein
VTTYVVTDAGRPVFQARYLEEVAIAMNAQPNPGALIVYASNGDVTRPLSTREHTRLERLRR